MTMKPRITPIWILSMLVICSNVHGQANSWINTNFGKWETNSNWSLGVAPTNTQSGIFITNAFSKTVTIDSITSGSFPGTMTISNLTLSAPASPVSFNTLFLNNSGIGTPLRILNNFTISSNATLLVYSNSTVLANVTPGSVLTIDGGGFVNLLDGGALIATNGDISVLGSSGVGEMVVNNGKLTALDFRIGRNTVGARGTLTLQAGLVEITSGLQMGGFGTGTVWVTGGQLLATNASTFIANFGSGRLTVSNGTVNAGTVTLALNVGSAGTLTVAGGTFTAERLLVTNISASLLFTGGDMTLRGLEYDNNLGFGMGGAGRIAVLNLPGGTNRVNLGALIGQTTTALVWITGGHLVITNGTTTIGDAGFGQVTLSNGSWRARDVRLGRAFLSTGVLNVAGGTNLLTSDLRLGSSDVTSTGIVSLTGGQLVVTNNLTYVGDIGAGRMTVSNGTYLARDMRVGNAAGSRGTLTFAGGTNLLSGGLVIASSLASTGTLWLTGGQLITTNGGITVSFTGVGQMIVSNGTWLADVFGAGLLASAQGTITIAGGTNEVTQGFDCGTNPFATGTLWMVNGLLTATNGEARIGSSGTGRLIVSNGLVRLRDLYVGRFPAGSGTLTIDGGTVTVANLIVSNATSTVLFDAGRLIVTNVTSVASTIFDVGAAPFTGPAGPGTAILNLSGVSHQFNGGMLIGLNATGEVWVTGTQLVVTNFLTVGGGGRTGLLTLSNATAVIGGMAVGSSGSAVVTLTCVNSTMNLSSFLQLGSFEDGDPRDTGTVWIVSGQLVVTNDVTRVGSRADGSIIVSNGTVLLKELQIATNSTARGTVTAAGGAIDVSGPVTLGFTAGATGTVWLTGGQLTTTNNTDFVAMSGVGRMTVSNGTWRARHVIVGPISGSQGSLTVAGGVSIVYSNLTVGNFACTATGIVNVTGGQLRVTNNAANAVLEMRNGTLTQSGGTLDVDRLIITNACARFIHTGGTLIYGILNLSTNAFFDADDDGIDNKWEMDYGLDPLDPADAALDNDGDGQNNLEEFTMGTDPNDANSRFRIISIVRTNNDVRITWTVAPKSGNGVYFLDYIVQFGTNLLTGVTNNLSPVIFVGPGFVGTTTNYTDVGGATNRPARFYRIWGFPD